MRKILFVLLLGLSIYGADEQVFDKAAPPEQQKDLKFKILWTVTDGIQNPESVYYDASSHSLFVSNVAGAPNGKDGVGWISKLTPQGKIVKQKWIEGMDAPKGMRSHVGTLWVSDITKVHAINIKSGKIEKTFEVPQSKFLNDVAIDSAGNVYVSDTMGSKIFIIKKGKVEVFAEGPELESPNGLLVHGNKLLVGAWGLAADDFSTVDPGRLYSLDLKSKERKNIIPAPFANLDGLELKGEDYLVSDWKAGKVFLIRKDGTSKLLIAGFEGAADLAYLPKTKTLIVPRMGENKVTAFDLTKCGK